MNKIFIATTLALFFITVSFAQTFTVDGVTYTVIDTDTNEVEVTDGDVTTGLIIPSTVINDEITYTVTAIGVDALPAKGLRNLTLPNTLVTIGSRAFERNRRLAALIIPKNVTSIGNKAFIATDDLVSVTSINTTPPTLGTTVFGGNDNIKKNLTVPVGTVQAYLDAGWTAFFSVNGVATIGKTFKIDGITYEVSSNTPNEVKVRGNTNSGAIVIPSQIEHLGFTFSVTEIGVEAFEGDGITSVSIPTSVTQIRGEAFHDNELTSLVIPTSVTNIGSGAFRQNNLTDLSIPSSVTNIGNNAFRENSLTSIIIGNNVATIGDNAFRFNQLETVTIPAQVTTIGGGAFAGNPNVLTVVSLATTPPSILQNTPDVVGSFGEVDQKELTVPTGTTQAYLNAGWTGFKSINGAIDAFTIEGISYQVTSLDNNTNTVKITGNTNSGAITIPSQVTEGEGEGGITYTITEIGVDAFRDDTVTSIVIPDGVTHIGNGAFRENNITAVSIPSSVTSIGNGSFAENNITTLSIGNNVTTIGNNTFRFNQLETVTIPAQVTTIGGGAFAGNPNVLTVVSLAITPPSIVQDTQDVVGSFGEVDQKELTVPTGTTQAYFNAGWTGFKSINGVTDAFTIEGISYQVTSLDNNTNTVKITGNTNSGTITIPSQVTESESGITYTVTEIGGEAFKGDGVTSVSIPTSVTQIGGEAFQDNELTSIELPDTLISIGSGAFQDNELTSVVIPEGITAISDFTFEDNRLINVVIPTSVTSIGDSAFERNLYTSIEIPESVTTIGSSAFASTRLTSIVLPEGITVISDSAFRNTDLTSIVIPSGVTSIGEFAFFNNDLTSAVIPDGVTSIGDNAFRSNDLTSIIIPDSVTTIGDNAFTTNNLTSLVIPDSVTFIGLAAFGVNNLTSIIISNSVTSISASGFINNPNLVSVTSNNPTPPTLGSFVFNQTGNDKTLFVPRGTRQAYIDAGWTAFNTIEQVNIKVAPKVFLQGASVSPIAGEEDLMRDSLRENGLLPTTSPYGDGETVDPAVFDVTGNDAIVDWVFVTLREGLNNENTTVVASQAALLQRDGDIVGLDGVAEIGFRERVGVYFISIRHRNHIGVLAAVPAALGSVASAFDFTQDVTAVKGENLALTTLVNGTFAMIAGDADGSSQILNTDITEGLTLAGGGQAYSTADADMNGFVLNSDIQLLILGNSGTVQQFE
jgi:hypothetical protein